MSWEIRQGHVLTRLAEFADESVHCVVTSPPFYGLRDYGTAVWDGGREDCDHVEREIRTGLGLAEWSAVNAAGGGHKAGDVDRIQFRGVCGKCGARAVDEQIGLEATPEEYVEKLVKVFREVRRVLRSDGTLWLNIGDSYARGFGGGSPGEKSATNTGSYAGRVSRSMPSGLKDKDLVGIPWLLAFALRADGWYLRSDVIWAKPNPMPESVTDRPTSAHEHVFLLAKSARYFYDADAIRETDAGPTGGRQRAAMRQTFEYADEDYKTGHVGNGHDGLHRAEYTGKRNKRNVWEIATQPYPDAHFATFPPKLVEPCILAGSSPKACGECGAPWERVVEATGAVNHRERVDVGDWIREKGGNADGKRSLSGSTYQHQRRGTDRWQPSCAHDDDTGSSVILDPFAGSGTVGVVCEWHGRDFVGLELNEEYARMARRRITAEGPLGRPARRPRPLPDDHATLFELT